MFDTPHDRLSSARTLGCTASVRVAAVLLALAGSSCARGDERWVLDLADRDPFVRALAAIALCEQAPARSSLALPVLLETIDRAELGLEPVAAAQLERIGPRVVDELLSHLVREEFMTSDRRRAVIAALIAAGPAAVPSVVAAVRGPARPLAGELGVVLVQIGEPSVGALLELLADRGDPQLQIHAAWLLGRLGPRAAAALPALRTSLLAPDAGVRGAAAEALAQIESRPAVPGREPAGSPGR